MAERRTDKDEPSGNRVANRMRRPSWRDGRLVAGVIMVLVAMLAGALTLAHFDDSVQVVRAKHVLLPGDTVGVNDVEVVKVRLDTGRQAYFVGAARPGGTVLREVRAGELLPRSAVGSVASVGVRSIALPVGGSGAAALVRGSVVDVWIAAKTPGSTATDDFRPPSREVERAMVQRVPGDRSGLSVSAGGDQVSVLVPESKVASLIAAMNGGSRITLVPAAGSPMKGD
ncbi:hypothetical protein [Calidifontibacter terrae]